MARIIRASRVFERAPEKGWDCLSPVQKRMVEKLRKGSMDRRWLKKEIPVTADQESAIATLRYRGFLVDFEKGRYILVREPGVPRWCRLCDQKLSQYNPYLICESCRIEQGKRMDTIDDEDEDV